MSFIITQFKIEFLLPFNSFRKVLKKMPGLKNCRSYYQDFDNDINKCFSLFFSKKFSRVNIKIILFLLAHFNIFFSNYLFFKVCSTFFTCVWFFIYFLSFMNVQKFSLRVSRFPYTLLMIACTNHIILRHFCYNFLISHVYHIFLFYGLFLM